MASSKSSSDPNTIIQRFQALAISQGVGKKNSRYKALRKEFIEEEVQRGFVAAFGANASSLQAWQGICTTVGIQNAKSFTSIKQCKTILKTKFVNIVDLVDAGSERIMTKGVFGSRKELAQYIKNAKGKKTFPKEKAKRNPLLRHFLITLN